MILSADRNVALSAKLRNKTNMLRTEKSKSDSKDDKIEELKKVGVPEKYWAELARKKIEIAEHDLARAEEENVQAAKEAKKLEALAHILCSID